MIHRYVKLLILILAAILLFIGCAPANTIKESDIIGKTYTYEKEGFGSDFTIQMKEDGTFYYYEGLLSSYIGIGKWTLIGDILLLSDDVQSPYVKVNYFKVDRDELVFISENSSNFSYLKVGDGERFSGKPTGAK